MDKKQITGLVIISTILIAYNYFFAPKPIIVNNSEKTENNIEAVDKTTQENTVLIKEEDSVKTVETTLLPAQDFLLENENFKILFTSNGGHLKEVTLKKYNNQNKEPLILLDEKSSRINYSIVLENDEVIETKDLYFTKSENEIDTNDKSLTLIATTQTAKTILFKFSIDDNGYTLKHELIVKENDKPINYKKATLTWKDEIKRAEQDIKACRNKTNISYYSIAEKFDYLKESSTKKEELSFQNPIKWIAVKQRFFTSAIIAEEQFDGGNIELSPAKDTEETVKSASTILNFSTKKDKTSFTFYFGPNDYRVLKHVTPDFGKILPLGWPIFRWINTLIVIPIFDLLQNCFSNFGVIIMLLVIFIKILILPISYKAYISTAKIKLLKPAIDELKERFGPDMHKLQMEQMKLYKEVGANPLGGLGLALLQMPILLAMFNFIPNEIAFRQQPFLVALLPWANDLSTYDILFRFPFSIPAYGSHVSLFTLLMTVSTILHTLANSEIKSQQGPLKILAYTMPITFMFILNSFPAALSFYYFVSNLATLAIQAIIKKSVNEEKIKQKLEENKRKTQEKGKTSSLKSRLNTLLKNR